MSKIPDPGEVYYDTTMILPFVCLKNFEGGSIVLTSTGVFLRSLGGGLSSLDTIRRYKRDLKLSFEGGEWRP